MRRKRVVKTFTSALARTNRPSDSVVAGELVPTGGRRQRITNMGDGLANLVAGLGTGRDKRSYTDYTPVLGLSSMAAENLFQSSWLANRIVSTVADDMTREWVELSWDGQDNKLDESKALRQAEADFDIKGKSNEALCWSRLHGGAVIFAGIKGERDQSQPLIMESIKKGSLEMLHVLDRWRITPTGAIDKVPGPHFGQPLLYRLAESGPSVSLVHWTRLIRFDGRKLPYAAWMRNQMWDASELQHVLDSVKDYDATRAGIASMVWESNVDILKASNVALELSTDEGTARVNSRLLNGLTMKNFLKTWVIDKDTEEFGQKVINFSGLVEVVKQFITDVCGAADIPVTRLFGQSPAGLTTTGESDVRNYYNGIGNKQQSQLRPGLRRMYEMLVRSTLGRFPANFDIKFRPLWQISAVEQAAIDKTKADIDAIYLDQGVVNEGLVARELKNRNLYKTMEDKDVRLAEQVALEPDPLETPTTLLGGKARPRQAAPDGL